VLTAIGLGGATAATYATVKSQDAVWLLGTVDGLLLAGVGFEALTQDGPFEYLAKYARNDPAHPAGTEQEWLRAAQVQRRTRRIASGTLLAWAAVATGVGALSLAQDEGRSDANRYGTAIAWFGLAAINGTLAVWYLANPSPLEDALHDYERRSGRIVTDGAFAPKFRLAAAPSGFTVGLSGSF